MGCDQPGPAPAGAHPGRPGDLPNEVAAGGSENIPFSPEDLAFSAAGGILASATGTDQVTLWNVTDPARAYRMATIDGAGDFIQAFAFSPRGNLLAAVTYHGTVLVFSLADPARPARTGTARGLLARARFPGRAVPARRDALRHL